MKNHGNLVQGDNKLEENELTPFALWQRMKMQKYQQPKSHICMYCGGVLSTKPDPNKNQITAGGNLTEYPRQQMAKAYTSATFATQCYSTAFHKTFWFMHQNVKSTHKRRDQNRNWLTTTCRTQANIFLITSSQHCMFWSTTFSWELDTLSTKCQQNIPTFWSALIFRKLTSIRQSIILST